MICCLGVATFRRLNLTSEESPISIDRRSKKYNVTQCTHLIPMTMQYVSVSSHTVRYNRSHIDRAHYVNHHFVIEHCHCSKL